LLKSKSKNKNHRDQGEISLLKVVKNYILRIILILISKIISIRIKKINFKLILCQNPKSNSDKKNKNDNIEQEATLIEFLNACITNLTLNQIYSKNEKFIFYIKADNAQCKAFDQEIFSEKKASAYILKPGTLGLFFNFQK
jgi:hypothetical protein